ncbi:MAG: hypothetical protein HHAS10_06440 [Candidatus Altimarinota bacterium]
MDINSLISSSIRKNGNLYEIKFPNFFGFVEGVLYMHDSLTIDYCSGIFGKKLDLQEWKKPVDAVFLMSQVFGLILIRIIHAKNPLEDTIIAAKAAKIVTFQIREEIYFGILYYTERGELKLLTDFHDSQIFRSSFENGIWSISNILTGTNLQCFSFPCEIAEDEEMRKGSIKECSFYLLEDSLFPQKHEKQFIESFLESIISYNETSPHIELEKDGENLTKITIYKRITSYENDSLLESKKLIGIIGNHLIITEDPDILPDFLSLDSVEKLGIESVEGFSLSEEIGLFNPNWHILRVMLLELGYLVYSIEKHIMLTRNSLKQIGKIDSPYLENQEYRSKITLEGLERIKTQYQITLETLLKGIKKSQNLI